MTPQTLLAFSIALSVSTLLGYFIVDALFRALPRSFVWVCAPGIGAGLCSLIDFLFRRPMFTVEIGLLVILAARWLLSEKTDFAGIALPSWRPPLIGLVLFGALGMAISGLLLRADRIPHGDWDGWAIWNSHARVIYRIGSNWQNHIQSTFHPDYPLLTPILTARFWRYAGQEVPEAAALVGILFTLSAIGVLAVTLSQLRDTRLAVLIGLVLMGTPFYLELGVSHYADVPLSFFILCTIALICLHFERYREHMGLVIAAGFTAGCAGWTKNEGLLFIAAAGIVMSAPVLRRRAETLRRLAAFAAGLLLPLLVILYFKIAIAPPNDLIAEQHYPQTIQKLQDLDRHGLILAGLAQSLWSFGAWSLQPMIPLFAFIGLRGADRDAIRSSGWLMGAAILGIVLAGYYFVYVMTPVDLQTHLDSTANRLVSHLWPSFLLLAGLVAMPSAGNTRNR